MNKDKKRTETEKQKERKREKAINTKFQAVQFESTVMVKCTYFVYYIYGVVYCML